MLKKSICTLLMWFLATWIASPVTAENNSTPEILEGLGQLAFTEGDWALTAFIYNEDGSVARQFDGAITVKPILGGKGYLGAAGISRRKRSVRVLRGGHLVHRQAGLR